MTQLHLLWERAGLTSWTPADRKRRNFWIGVRNQVMIAADAVVSGQEKLGRHLAVIGYHDADVATRLGTVLNHGG